LRKYELASVMTVMNLWIP